ncbi:MAG: diguanylate cyclase [Thermodesulfobacteriota bacterium]
MPQSLKLIRSFLLLSCATMAAVVVAIFVSYHLRAERLTEDILLQQARALFDEMILTRQWVSEHGGVYVRARAGVDPDPFLTTIPGLKVNITDEEGQLYTLRNPGLVVSGISRLAEKQGQFRLHVASLRPVNARDNSPDPFERQALLSFERGAKEAHTMEETPGGEVYRYMAPLYFRQECNSCHRGQGYREGDIRGGISVTIPMAFVNAGLAENRRYTMFTAFLVVALLTGFLFFQSNRYLNRIKETQLQLVALATLDSLTGLLNRRSVYERLEEEIAKHRRFKGPLSCLMLDIDHFKDVNDSHGHLAGDAVLVAIAENLKAHSRKYDIISRYGGEEFLIILPATDLEAAVTVAEKLRQRIADLRVPHAETTLQVTVSLGVAELATTEEEADSLVGRADSALYRAKSGGRNRLATDPA